MLQYFSQGGPIMWVIFAVSVYGLGVFIERCYHLYTIRIDSQLLLADLRALLRAGDGEGAGDILRRTPGPLPAVLRSGLRHANRGITAVRESMQQTGEMEMRSVDGKVRHLALIANISPLLGLLGTVTGMINAFASISAQGLGNPAIVANGISAALLTTAYGLIVALPAIIAYNFLDGRIEAIRCECEDRSAEFIAMLEDAAHEERKAA